MPELSPQRELMTTASQAPVIVNGTGAQLYELWEERVGLRPPKDFSRNIQVQRGKHDEPFILFWSELINGISITERGTFFKHPHLPSISCTLDGLIADWNAVYEAKCQSEFRDLQDILTWYTPQVLVQMRCTGAARGILGVLQSNLTELEVTVDEAYEREVWEYLAAFQLCVDTMTPPHEAARADPARAVEDDRSRRRASAPELGTRHDRLHAHLVGNQGRGAGARGGQGERQGAAARRCRHRALRRHVREAFQKRRSNHEGEGPMRVDST